MRRAIRVFLSFSSSACWSICRAPSGTCGAEVVRNKPSLRLSGLQEVVLLSKQQNTKKKKKMKMLPVGMLTVLMQCLICSRCVCASLAHIGRAIVCLAWVSPPSNVFRSLQKPICVLLYVCNNMSMCFHAFFYTLHLCACKTTHV